MLCSRFSLVRSPILPRIALTSCTRRCFSSTLRIHSADLPLSGLTVVDLTRVLAGPYSTQILADLGANVIKVEHPVRGDDTRSWGPPYAINHKDQDSPGESAYFLGVNRNKKSIGINFKDPKAVEILKQLIQKADILVENYIPGALSKYGLAYNQLNKPDLIYASITGYGQTGPYSQRAGYDVMVEAEFGLMHITGEPDGPPVKVGVAVIDLTTGLYTSNAIMAALIYRARTGKGQHLDICLSDCQIATLANIGSSVLISGKKDSGRQGTAHPSICPYQAFSTADGDIMIGGGNDRLFGVLCDILDKPEWKTDSRFASNSLRVKYRHVIVPLIEQVVKTKTTGEWLKKFENKGMPYAPINDVKTALEDPHTLARNMIVEIEHPDCGLIKLINNPVKFSETQPEIRTPPPTLGQHTDEIMLDLGFNHDDIKTLRENGTIG